jgi:LysM repeat protein
MDNFSNFYTTSSGVVTNMSNGYEFYFKIGEDVLTFPITPNKLTIKVGSNNKVVTLINEGDINILKSPSLVEIEFEARFPMRKYPYSREVLPFQTYFDKIKDLKENKKSFRFIVARATPNGKSTWGTDLLVALEDFQMSENAEEGDDVLIDFKLKQYKEYGIKVLPNSSANNNTTTSTSEQPRPTEGKGETSSVYVVQSGDCLWNIAKAAYGDAFRWKEIYETNKEAIEADARKHGKQSSNNGNWIWAGLELVIPGISDAGGLKVTKLW